MSNEIKIIDRGRGMQLSTSRITVMDLVPYFQHGDSPEEIMRWIPSLNPEGIAVAHAYYRQHKDELDAEDRQVGKYREEQVRTPTKAVSSVERDQEGTNGQVCENGSISTDRRRTVKGILADGVTNCHSRAIRGQIPLWQSPHSRDCPTTG